MDKYPDILLMDSFNGSISKHTLKSIKKFGNNSKIFFNIEPPLEKNNSMIELRNNILKYSESDWVFFLDTDDIINKKLTIDKTQDEFDLIIYNYFDLKSKTNKNINSIPIQQYFGFHMIICKQNIAKKAIKKYIKKQILRDDICFLYECLKISKKIIFSNEILTIKLNSRFGNSKFSKKMTKEIYDLWIPKFSSLSLENKIILRK